MIVSSSNWSNATFEIEFCRGLWSRNWTGLLLLPALDGYAVWELPDCFYNYTSLTHLDLAFVIIKGTTQTPDPVERLAQALTSNTSSIEMRESYFVGTSDTSSALSLGPLISHQSLDRLSLKDVHLGPAPYIPSDLSSVPESLHIIKCGLTGAVPSGIFTGSDSAARTIDLSFNALSALSSTAAVPPGLFSLTLNLAQNQFSGAFPSKLFDLGLPDASIFELDLSGNRFDSSLSGILPDRMFTNNVLTIVSISVQGNAFTGSIPTWFSGMGSGLTDFVFRAHDNALSGEIPFNLLSSIDFTRDFTGKFVLSLGGNQLVGSISPLLTTGMSPFSASSYTLNFSSNALNASLPQSLTTGLNLSQTICLDLNISSTNLTGILSSTLNTPLPNILLHLYAASTSLNYLDLFGGLSARIRELDISNSNEITGTLPFQLFSENSVIRRLKAFNTSLTGTMPDMSYDRTSLIEEIDLRHTLIDFCSTPRTNYSADYEIATCNFGGTNASMCPQYYPDNCLQPPPVPPSPPATTIPPPSTLACSNGSCSFNGTFTQPTLVIPPGIKVTSVNGNITSSNIVLPVGSTIVVNGGCLSNLSVITIEFTDEDLKRLGKKLLQDLVSINGSTGVGAGCVDLGQVSIQSKVKGSSCRKVNVESVPSTDQLSALFTIDSSACNTWWIILVAVLASIVVLGVIVMVLLILFVRPVREFVRPYSKSRKPSEGLNS